MRAARLICHELLVLHPSKVTYKALANRVKCDLKTVKAAIMHLKRLRIVKTTRIGKHIFVQANKRALLRYLAKAGGNNRGADSTLLANLKCLLAPYVAELLGWTKTINFAIIRHSTPYANSDIAIKVGNTIIELFVISAHDFVDVDDYKVYHALKLSETVLFLIVDIANGVYATCKAGWLQEAGRRVTHPDKKIVYRVDCDALEWRPLPQHIANIVRKYARAPL